MPHTQCPHTAHTAHARAAQRAHATTCQAAMPPHSAVSRAAPLVSTSTQSNLPAWPPSASSSASSACTNSALTLQQRQPLASSTHWGTPARPPCVAGGSAARGRAGAQAAEERLCACVRLWQQRLPGAAVRCVHTGRCTVVRLHSCRSKAAATRRTSLSCTKAGSMPGSPLNSLTITATRRPCEPVRMLRTSVVCRRGGGGGRGRQGARRWCAW